MELRSDREEDYRKMDAVVKEKNVKFYTCDHAIRKTTKSDIQKNTT